MNRFDSIFQRVKLKILNQIPLPGYFEQFSNCIEILFQVKPIYCELERLRTDQLRLNIIVEDREDEYKFWNKGMYEMSENDKDLLRRILMRIVRDNKLFEELAESLMISTVELDHLIINIRPYFPFYRTYLNREFEESNLKKIISKIIGQDDFTILREFEMILILLRAPLMNENRKALSEKISEIYTKELRKRSEHKKIFLNRSIQVDIEDKKEFDITYGNLKNYLN